MALPPPHTSTIADCVAQCLTLFRSFTNDKISSGTISSQAIDDGQTRFKIWSGNIGAHKTGMGSLDYRLRDSSNIRNQVVNLLQDLSGLLEDAIAIATGEKVPWDQLSVGLDDDDNEDAGAESDGFPETEIEQISMDVTDTVSCLLRLSVSIRNPAPHNRFARSLYSDTSHFEPFDMQHVKSKFSALDRYLVERLGKAISRRRQYFKYRENHHAKLALGLEDGDEAAVQSTIASSIPHHLKDNTGEAYGPLVFGDDHSESGNTQTSFATSVADSQKLRVPPLPDTAYQGAFECPFCFLMIAVIDRRAWKYVNLSC